MTKPHTSHPAPFPRYVLDRIALYVRAEARALGRPAEVLDVFAGVGRIHDLPKRYAITTGVELEPEWVACRARTIQGDATALPEEWTGRFDCIATSPSYGNRLADNYEARDSCAGCGGTGVTISEEGCSEAPWCCANCGVACTCGVLEKELKAHNRRCLVCRGQVCPSCGGNGLSKRFTYRRALGRAPSEGSSATLQWGCVTPDVPVLRGDWRWVPAGELMAGDPLIAFDAEIPAGPVEIRRRGRRWREGKVLATARAERPCVEVRFTDGSAVTATADHPWLVDRQSEPTQRRWRRADQLRLGDRIPVLMPTWAEDRSYEAGWLAGMFDGEGSYSYGRDQVGFKGRLTITQRPGPIWDRILELLEHFGARYAVNPGPSAHAARILGGLPMRMDLLGRLRPERLLAKTQIDGHYMRAVSAREVADVCSVGDREVALLATSTQTYVADGMGAHNTSYRALHRRAWTEAHRVLRPGGLMMANIKDHVRDGAVQRVSDWHETCLTEVGFAVLDVARLPAPGIRHGQNHQARVEEERIIVGRKGTT